ncbi:MAG: helix-turn-helix domain-containing protein [Candidatus Scalindua sp.]|nr:helix-turn-helix domain-containing protein [Candidatus Scalindua sp.]MBT6052864.1 helix-turn-helix domain-containing protein [Candidatus Scalindua sp.]MBT6230585.1 helix-turn-helix domain-containing protein [Candidatus Scalindua sp.]
MKKLLSVNDVAEYLDVPKSTIRYWCFTKKLRHYKIGRHLKFDRIDINEYLESNLIERR